MSVVGRAVDRSIVGRVDELTWDDVVVEMSSVVSVFDRAVELLRLCADVEVLCVAEDTFVEADRKPVKTYVIV